MARIVTTVDDLTGDTLNEDVEATVISVDGQDYSVDLGAVGKDRLIKWLNGEDALMKTPAGRPAASRRAAGSGGTTIDTYGHPVADVRTWAQANNVKNANGNPVGDRGRISQTVYDAYKQAQEK